MQKCETDYGFVWKRKYVFLLLWWLFDSWSELLLFINRSEAFLVETISSSDVLSTNCSNVPPSQLKNPTKLKEIKEFNQQISLATSKRRINETNGW